VSPKSIAALAATRDTEVARNAGALNVGGHFSSESCGLHAYDSPAPFNRPVLRKEPGMLVLSRQRDETIIIGDNIEITVVDIRGDKVRLGVSAPKEISVHRKEVYDAIRRENREAAQVKPEDLSALGKMSPRNPKGPEKKQ
jgi:carbon storage regulator